MGNMGNMGGPAPSFQMKCNNCKQDVTIGPASQKVKCPRCGCGVFIDMQNPSRMGQPTQNPQQYVDGAKRHTDFSTIRPVSPTSDTP